MGKKKTAKKTAARPARPKRDVVLACFTGLVARGGGSNWKSLTRQAWKAAQAFDAECDALEAQRLKMPDAVEKVIGPKRARRNRVSYLDI